MNNSIGNKLKSLRKQKGLSQEQVCECLHISQSAYSRLESGESQSWVSLIDKICEVFEITPLELIKNENNIVNNNQQGDSSTYAISVKLIEQYEEKMKEKDEIIAELKARLKNFEE